MERAPYIDGPPRPARAPLAIRGLHLAYASVAALVLSVIAYAVHGTGAIRYGFTGTMVAAAMAGTGLLLVLRCRETRGSAVGIAAVYAAASTLAVTLAQLPLIALGLAIGCCSGSLLSW